MYCSNCGKEIDAGAKFCPECGTKIEQNPEEQKAEVVEQAYNESSQQSPEAVKSNKAAEDDIEFSQGYTDMSKELPKNMKAGGAKKKLKLLLVIVIIIAVAILLLLGLFFGGSESGRIKQVKNALKGSWEASYEYKGKLMTDELDFFLEDGEKALSTAGAIYKSADKEDDSLKSSEIEGVVKIEESAEYSGSITIDNDEIGGTFGTLVVNYSYEPSTKELKLSLKSYWPSKNVDEFSYNLKNAGKITYEKMD